jgi:hypothetical protein
MAILQTATTAFKLGLLKGTFDFDVDTFYMALYTANATLNADTTAYTPTGEVPASGTYVAGGQIVTIAAAPASGGGVAYINFNNVSWNAALTARAALIYKPGDNGAVCVLDFGSDKTSVTTFTVQMPTNTSTTALIRIA